jgi:hypothetical protein
LGSKARITAPQHCCPLYPDHPTLGARGGRSKFTRDTATGAVFKAADLVRDGWTGFTFVMKPTKPIGLIGSIS